jgi:hypothetical protein
MTESERDRLKQLLMKRIRIELKSPICLPAWGTLALKLIESNTPKTPEDPEVDVFSESTRNLPFSKKGR